MNERCSIIIPTYNNSIEQYIRLFNSINQQTALSNIYVIMVDDASTLGILTETFIKENLNCDFRLIKLEKNCGAGYARQIALNNMDTEFFMFIDADDCIGESNTIEQYLFYLDNNPEIDVVCGWEENKIYNKNINKEFELHGACGRKTILKNCFFPSTHYAEDWVFASLIKINGYKTEVLPFVSYYRQEGFLTRNIQALFIPFMEVNSLFLYIKELSNLSFEDLNKSNKLKHEILNTLNKLYQRLKREKDKRFQSKENKRFENLFEQRHEITEKDFEIITLYYYLAILNTIPKDKLKDWFVYDDFCNPSYSLCDDLICHAGEVLLNKKQWYIPLYEELFSFKDLEKEMKKIIDRYIEIANENLKISKDSTEHLPKQVLQSFPWCFNNNVSQWISWKNQLRVN